MGLQELNIPEQTETIGDYAFVTCMGLKTAVIPSHVKHINNNAFTGCIDLVSADLPESITSISGDMFLYCTALKEITFRGTIEKIGYGAFNHCDSLQNFQIPETVTYIGVNAFTDSGCVETENGIDYVGNWAVGSDEKIQEIVVKNGTVGIAEMSFFVRNNATLLDIPQTVKYMGSLCFGELSSGTPAKINFGSAYLGEKVLSGAKTTTDIYIYDPSCEIFDSEKTIPATYRYQLPTKVENTVTSINTINPDFQEKIETYFENLSQQNILSQASSFSIEETQYAEGDVVIHGYENSTAQKYAEKYGRKFEVIPLGDVNGDDELNVSDVVLLYQWLKSAPDVRLTNWKSADLYEDGKLDVIDLALMKQKLLAK